MRALVLSLLTLLPPAAPAAAQEEPRAVQRSLGGLRLGDTLEDVQRLYPPAQEWPMASEPRGGVKRIRVERPNAKSFPPDVEILLLGLKRGRLVEIQLVYDARFSRKKSAEVLAERMSLIYGDPSRSNDKFWWADGRTVLRVFNAELPATEAGEEAVELRTSVQVMERALFRRGD